MKLAVKITSDSTCDLSEEIINKYEIGIIPLTVTLGEASFKDGIEMNVGDIYEYVDRTGSLPKTSAVNISEYMDAFQKYVDEGYEIVHINLSAEFSSTYQNACLAAEETGHVHVLDSRNLSTGQGLIVMKAAEMSAAGKSAEEIYQVCREMTDRVEASFVIDSLEYLYKGGRCSALSAFGANLLKLKPCIVVDDGKMSPEKKYRGAFEKVILQYVRDRLKDREDIDYSRIFITHTRCSEKCVQDVREAIEKYAPEFNEIIETTAGSTITTHCGPNTLGILFVRSE